MGGYSSPTIDLTAFPATSSILYWSSIPYPGDSSVAWYVSGPANYRTLKDPVRYANQDGPVATQSQRAFDRLAPSLV